MRLYAFFCKKYLINNQILSLRELLARSNPARLSFPNRKVWESSYLLKNMYFFSSLFASQRRKKVPKKEEKTQLFSTSSLCSAVFHFRLRRIFLLKRIGFANKSNSRTKWGCRSITCFFFLYSTFFLSFMRRTFY